MTVFYCSALTSLNLDGNNNQGSRRGGEQEQEKTNEQLQGGLNVYNVITHSEICLLRKIQS